jgi:hypothetical protein
VYAGFQCDKPPVLGDTIKGTLCILVSCTYRVPVTRHCFSEVPYEISVYVGNVGMYQMISVYVGNVGMYQVIACMSVTLECTK